MVGVGISAIGLFPLPVPTSVIWSWASADKASTSVEFLCLLLVEPRSISAGVRPSLAEGSGFRPWPESVLPCLTLKWNLLPLREVVLVFRIQNPEHLDLGVSASAVHN